MLQTGSKAWSIGLDEVMKQINDSPHESLPTGVTPNHVMFSRKRQTDTREPLSTRGLVMAVSEETINRVCSIDKPDINESGVGAVELALEMNIKEVQIGADDNESENEPEYQRSADRSPIYSPIRSPSRASSPSRAPISSPKGKEKVVEVTLSEEEAENEPEAAAEEHKNDEDKDDSDNNKEAEKEGMHPNAREPVNDAVRNLDNQILQHQTHQREKMQKKYNASHKIIIFKENDFASMAIPKENRAPTDNLRMMVKILKIPRQNRHKVQSRYGVIKGLISTGSLNVVPEQLITDLRKEFHNAPKKKVLLS